MGKKWTVLKIHRHAATHTTYLENIKYCYAQTKNIEYFSLRMDHFNYFRILEEGGWKSDHWLISKLACSMMEYFSPLLEI